MKESFKNTFERADSKILKSIIASLTMLGIAQNVEAKEIEVPQTPIEFTNTGTDLIESLRVSGNEAAVKAYETGIKELSDNARTKDEEDVAIFVIYDDGSFVWDDLEILSSNFVKGENSISATYVTEDINKYRIDTFLEHSQYIVIHTHPTSLSMENNSVPPSPVDIKETFNELAYFTEESFSRAHFQIVTENNIWEYGFEDYESYSAIDKLRTEAMNFGKSLNNPEDIEALNEIIRTFSDLDSQNLIDAELLELFTQHGSIFLQEDFIFTDPDSLIMLPVSIKILYEKNNLQMPDNVKKLVSKLSVEGRRIIQEHKIIDPNSDGLYVLPPIPDKYDEYIKRWEGVGFFMREKHLED